MYLYDTRMLDCRVIGQFDTWAVICSTYKKITKLLKFS